MTQHSHFAPEYVFAESEKHRKALEVLTAGHGKPASAWEIALAYVTGASLGGLAYANGASTFAALACGAAIAALNLAVQASARTRRHERQILALIQLQMASPYCSTEGTQVHPVTADQ